MAASDAVKTGGVVLLCCTVAALIPISLVAGFIWLIYAIIHDIRITREAKEAADGQD